MYLSQDPIGLAGNNPTLYGYVRDVNSWVDVWGLFLVYRGMITKGNSPFVYSGATTNGMNAANSLGVRPGEMAMSTSTTVGGLPYHRTPQGSGGKLDLYKIDTDVLDKYGLKAVKDGDTHVSIITKEGVASSELGDRLAKTKGEWVKVCS
jgi:uncharacterized protein RhaS with RHS repeats